MDPGIYYGMPDAEYRAIDAVSQSALKTLAARTPAGLAWEREHPRKPSEAMVLGSAVDCYLLEPDRFAELYEAEDPGEKSWPNATCPVCQAAPRQPCQTKKGEPSKRCCAGRRELHDAGGKTVLDWVQWQTVQGIVAAVRSHRQARTLLDLTQHQVSLVWTDAATGLLCKGRLDMAWPGHLLADLKTCRAGKAAPSQWPKHAWDLGYGTQAAFYHDGWRQLTGEDLPWFWLCVESTGPYLVAVHRAADAWVTRGRDAYRSALGTYAECLTSGVWPGYYCDDDPAPVSPPMWLPKIDNGEEEEFDE